MPNLNKVMLMGNLTRDPEMRYTPKGTAIAQGGLAINRKWKDEAGETKEEVCFVDWTAWGRVAETIGQYFKKGKPIYLEGRLKLDQWDDKQTNAKRSKLTVVVESFQFIDGAASEEGGERRTTKPTQQKTTQKTTKKGDDGYSENPSDGPPVDDDVPF